MQLHGVTHFGAVSDVDIFRHVQQLAAGELLAKILAGDIGDLRGFIENHHVGLRDQFTKAALFDHHIGHKQMMVDHHDVSIHRLTAGFDHEALFVQRAVAAEAIVVGAGDQRPDKAVFRHHVAGADIALFRVARPVTKMRQLAQCLTGEIAAGQRLLFKTFQTQIV